jgi:hypothetical protein
MTGCSDKNATGKDLDLLTNTPWKYEKAGFDSNDDGIFDALDPRIAGSEKDNTIIFCKDGTGYSALGPNSQLGSKASKANPTVCHSCGLFRTMTALFISRISTTK